MSTDVIDGQQKALSLGRQKVSPMVEVNPIAMTGSSGIEFYTSHQPCGADQMDYKGLIVVNKVRQRKAFGNESVKSASFSRSRPETFSTTVPLVANRALAARSKT